MTSGTQTPSWVTELVMQGHLLLDPGPRNAQMSRQKLIFIPNVACNTDLGPKEDCMIIKWQFCAAKLAKLQISSALFLKIIMLVMTNCGKNYASIIYQSLH